MSVIELVCATTVLSLVLSVTLVRGNLRADARAAECVQNLKETSLAFRQFANDNDDQFPMQVLEVFGGAREAANNGKIAGIFRLLSDYALQPGYTVCPADTRRAASSTASISANQLSYFVNLNARREQPETLLLGDRDLTFHGNDNSPGRRLTGLQEPTLALGETGWSGDLHRRGGNVATADGAVNFIRSSGLPALLRPSGLAPARLLFPQ